MTPISRRAALTALAGLPAFACGPVAAASASVPLTYDRDGRPTAPVRINGKGPFSLVVDTGAAGTVLTKALIEELGLVADPNMRAVVRGTSGETSMQLYNLDSIALGGFEKRSVRATELPHGGISDSRGVIGADTFLDGRLEFDFAGARLNARESGAAGAGWLTLKPRFAHRVLPLIPVTVGGVATTGLVDSGARATIGNPHLMRALGYAEGDPRLTAEDRPSGATGHISRTLVGGKAGFDIGGETLADQAMVFADLSVFASLGMGQGPGVIIGIDTLRRFAALAVDYPRAEVQLRPRR